MLESYLTQIILNAAMEAAKKDLPKALDTVFKEQKEGEERSITFDIKVTSESKMPAPSPIRSCIMKDFPNEHVPTDCEAEDEESSMFNAIFKGIEPEALQETKTDHRRNTTRYTGRVGKTKYGVEAVATVTVRKSLNGKQVAWTKDKIKIDDFSSIKVDANKAASTTEEK